MYWIWNMYYPVLLTFLKLNCHYFFMSSWMYPIVGFILFLYLNLILFTYAPYSFYMIPVRANFVNFCFLFLSHPYSVNWVRLCNRFNLAIPKTLVLVRCPCKHLSHFFVDQPPHTSVVEGTDQSGWPWQKSHCIA